MPSAPSKLRHTAFIDKQVASVNVCATVGIVHTLLHKFAALLRLLCLGCMQPADSPLLRPACSQLYIHNDTAQVAWNCLLPSSSCFWGEDRQLHSICCLKNEWTVSLCFLPPGLSASVYTSIYVGFEEPDAITYVPQPTQLHLLSAIPVWSCSCWLHDITVLSHDKSDRTIMTIPVTVHRTHAIWWYLFVCYPKTKLMQKAANHDAPACCTDCLSAEPK